MRADLPIIERRVLQRIKEAKIRLRFDKVVLRLVGGLQAALTKVVPDREAAIFTVTAPIRFPAKTSVAIESLVRDGLPRSERRAIVHGNHIRIRRLTNLPPGMPKVLGFVHDPESDAGLILALVEEGLRAEPKGRRGTSQSSDD